MKFYLFHLMPYAELDLDYDKKYDVGLGDAAEQLLRSEEGPPALQPLSRRTRLCRRARLRRRLRQRAPPERLRPDADPRRHRRRAGAPHQELSRSRCSAARCRCSTIRSAVAEEYAMLDNITGGRLIAGFVRGIGAEYHSTGVNPAEVARALPRGARPDHAGVDPARAVRRSRASTITSIRQHLAAPVPAAASADLDSLAGLARDHRMGLASGAQVHLSADLQPGRAARALHGACIAEAPSNYGYEASPRAARLGDRRSMSRHRRDRRIAKPSRTSRRSTTSSCACHRRCCCRRAICRLQSMMGVMQAKAAIGAQARLSTT